MKSKKKLKTQAIQPLDLLILSNGPGELITWVLPVVKAIKQKLDHYSEKCRISVILSPCPNATGKEVQLAQSFPGVDRVMDAKYFMDFLVLGKTKNNWDWHKKGVVLFLGGDQFFTVAIAQRLGYISIVYAEWDARWLQFVDRFGVMKSEILRKIPQKYHHKFTVVGDLMADLAQKTSPNTQENNKNLELIGLLPGSKPAKLKQGVPLCLATAEYIQTQRPQTRFIIPVAPTLDIETLAKFADSQFNPIIEKIGGVTGKLQQTLGENSNGSIYLQTPKGTKIELITEFPAYQKLSQCSLCLTTVGANTAELGSLAIPAIVLIPTQQLDAMRAWDGIPGILANLPILGSSFAKLINWLVLKYTIKYKKLYAWPNIWAKQEILPELIGELSPRQVGEKVLELLENPQKLEKIRINLVNLRGKSGAASKLAEIVCRELDIDQKMVTSIKKENFSTF